eukprot:435364_1
MSGGKQGRKVIKKNISFDNEHLMEYFYKSTNPTNLMECFSNPIMTPTDTKQKTQNMKTASISELIYDITTKAEDHNHKSALLLCFPVFTTSYELFNCLVKRFFVPDRNREILFILTDENNYIDISTDSDESVPIIQHNYKHKCFCLVHGYVSQIEQLLPSTKYFINTIPQSIVDLCCIFYIINDKSCWKTHCKVISTIQYWMRSYWSNDFDEDDKLLDKVEEFTEQINDYYIKDKEMTETDKTKGMKLIKILHKTMDFQEATMMRNKRTGGGPGHGIHTVDLWYGQHMDKWRRDFIKLNNKTLAEQITLMTEKLFKAISKREFIPVANTSMQPNFCALKEHNNNVCQWIQVMILQSKTEKNQGKLIRKFIRISDELLLLRNFQSLYAFYTALSSSVIQKLKHAWEYVTDKYVLKFKNIKVIFDLTNNTHNLRQLQCAAHPPLIPYIQIFMSDMAIILNGIDKERNDINLFKLMELSKFVENISNVQKSSIYTMRDAALQNILEHEFKLYGKDSNVKKSSKLSLFGF